MPAMIFKSCKYATGVGLLVGRVPVAGYRGVCVNICWLLLPYWCCAVLQPSTFKVIRGKGACLGLAYSGPNIISSNVQYILGMACRGARVLVVLDEFSLLGFESLVEIPEW